MLPLSDAFVQDIFLSNYRWQKSDIWSQASYRYAILWVAFLDPSDSYLDIFSTGSQKNMPGTVFYDEIVATLFSDVCDTFTISLSLLSWHA